MAKFVFLLATFAVLLILTKASNFQIEINKENPRRGEMGCRGQMEKMDNLKYCHRFMEKECCSGSCSCSCKGGSCLDSNTELFQKCCDSLEEMDEQCRCKNLKMMVEQHMMEGPMSQRMKEKMYESAGGMLHMCRLEPMRCDMGSHSLFP